VDPLFYRRMDSPVGPLLIGVSPAGLAVLEFDRGKTPRPPLPWRDANWVESARHTAAWAGQLTEYFAGKRRVFDLPLDLRGTAFQLRCWNALLEIPYGETRTYAQIARRVDSPRGFRAVGQANHDNPVAIVVPCHRVLTSSGSLGGYGGGLHIKQRLLELEGALRPTLF
jgi:O-6-methylguanine DNA methyltransferase